MSRLLQRGGLDVDELPGFDPASARRHAREAVTAGEIDVLVVAGGDGSVHLGVNACAGTGVALAILAAGTGNDIARGLAVPADPAALAAAILAGRTRAVDAGRLVGWDGQVRWWAGVLGGGFDSVVVARAQRWSRLPARWRYNLSVLRELPAFRAIDYRIVVDDEEVTTRAMLVAVANLPYFGGGMQVCPSARPDDGLLDVMVLHDVSIPTFLRVFPQVYSGRHVDHPRIQFLRGRKVRLEADRVVAQADGEPAEPLPIDLEAVPGALTVVTSPPAGRRARDVGPPQPPT